MRLRINDRIVHRLYGRATVQAIHEDEQHAIIRVVREKAPRRVLMRDCEKLPAALHLRNLRVVK